MYNIAKEVSSYFLHTGLLVQLRPSTTRLSRSNFSRIAFVIELLYNAVYPTKAQSLLNRCIIFECRPASVLLVENQPDSGILAMIMIKPISPLGSGFYVYLFHDLCRMVEIKNIVQFNNNFMRMK
jgi:hypothetical protein